MILLLRATNQADVCGGVFDLAKIIDCGMIDAAKSKWGQAYGKKGISLRGGGHIIQDHG
mgnify:CR=1 FL=1